MYLEQYYITKYYVVFWGSKLAYNNQLSMSCNGDICYVRMIIKINVTCNESRKKFGKLIWEKIVTHFSLQLLCPDFVSIYYVCVQETNERKCTHVYILLILTSTTFLYVFLKQFFKKNNERQQKRHKESKLNV